LTVLIEILRNWTYYCYFWVLGSYANGTYFNYSLLVCYRCVLWSICACKACGSHIWYCRLGGVGKQLWFSLYVRSALATGPHIPFPFCLYVSLPLTLCPLGPNPAVLLLGNIVVMIPNCVFGHWLIRSYWSFLDQYVQAKGFVFNSQEYCLPNQILYLNFPLITKDVNTFFSLVSTLNIRPIYQFFSIWCKF